MLQLIISIIFAVSLLGVVFMLYRKMPLLVELPQNGHHGIKKHESIVHIERKLKDVMIAFEKQIWLHKLLSFVKIITLRVEVILDNLLHGIRKKAQKIDKEIQKKK